MATRDHLQNIKKRGAVRTTNATAASVIEIANVQTAVDAMIRISGWVQAYQSGQSEGRINHFTAHGWVNGGQVAAGYRTYLEPDDYSQALGNLSWSMNVDADSGTVRIRVTGAADTTVDWFGFVEVDVWEVPVSFV